MLASRGAIAIADDAGLVTFAGQKGEAILGAVASGVAGDVSPDGSAGATDLNAELARRAAGKTSHPRLG